MKKLILFAMPLMLTAAFSFPGFARAEIATAAAAVSESGMQNETSSAASFEENLPGTETVPDENTQTEERATDSVAEPDLASEPKSEPEAEIESESEAEIESESEAEIESEPEPAEPDPFASEPYFQSSLKDIEEHLEQGHKLAVKSQEYNSRALSIIAGTSENRNFRRHCEFLTRVANHNVYAANLALLVFPRLLEVSNLICESSTRSLMHSFTNELINEPLAREIRLSELRNLLDTQAELARLLRNLSDQLADFVQQTGLQNSRRHVQGRVPEFLRAANRDMLVLLEQQNGQFSALLNQFEHHYQYCLVNLDYFLAVSDYAPGVMQGAQLGRIFRSCLDFSVSLHNYREEFRVFARKFEKQVMNRSREIEALVGKGALRMARIAGFTDNYPARDRDEELTLTFSAQPELDQSFALLDTMRQQAARLAEGEVSAITSEDDETSADAFAVLQSTLARHLASANWPITEFEAISQSQTIAED